MFTEFQNSLLFEKKREGENGRHVGREKKEKKENKKRKKKGAEKSKPKKKRKKKEKGFKNKKKTKREEKATPPAVVRFNGRPLDGNRGLS